jgi:hypothetical protein
VEEPNVRLDPIASNILGNLAYTAEIGLCFLGGQYPISPLEQVVDTLSDPKKLLRRVDYQPLGGEAEGVHERNNGLENLGNAAAGGCAVNMQHPKGPKVSR